MNGFILPPSLLVSGLLAFLALALNFISPGAAAVVGAIAALILMKLIIFGS